MAERQIRLEKDPLGIKRRKRGWGRRVRLTPGGAGCAGGAGGVVQPHFPIGRHMPFLLGQPELGHWESELQG